MELKQLCDPQPETRCDYPISARMKSVWNIQLNMLARLLEVCDKYGLKVYASSGTMLGAVRHGGYIPWDDDIDVDMFRDDYDKLVEVAPKEFSAPIFFQSAYTEKGYYSGHSQLRFDGTTAIVPGDMELGLKYHQGIFIDIFPFDPMPSDEAEVRRIMDERRSTLSFLWRRRYPRFNLNPFKLLKLALGLGVHAFDSDRQLYSLMEDRLRRLDRDNTDVWAALSFSERPWRWNINVDSYRECVMMPFERMQIPVPAGYDKELRKIYGDYMTPAKVSSLHGGLILDPDKPYDEVLARMQPGFLRYLLKKLHILKE